VSAEQTAGQLPWPAILQAGPVLLRPISPRDKRRWTRLREANRAWLEPWDATAPEGMVLGPPSFGEYARYSLRQARRGLAMPWVIELEGQLVGQLTISGIIRGAVLSGAVGYWIGEEFAGQGIMPTAVALAFDHAVGAGGLHRLEIAIRPENAPSLRVAEKLGFRDEGMRLRYLHVAGQWRDHRIFALTREDVPDGLLRRWQTGNSPS
jgi:ribosomal-protein-alanine N-acetyltransferase